MCGGGGAADQSQVLQARTEQLENERQGRIRQGALSINNAFDRFDDDFFGGFQNNFLDFYAPQLDDQFHDARGAVTTNLADRGILESTAGIRALGNLQEADNVQRTTLANQAIDESNALKQAVETERTNLFSLNEASADPSRLAPLIEGASTAFAAPQSFTPLEDVFGSVINSVAQFQSARNNSPQGGGSFFTPNRAAPVKIGSTGTGSGRVVR